MRRIAAADWRAVTQSRAATRLLLGVTVFLALSALLSAPAFAQFTIVPAKSHCKNGDPPKYDDISSVMFERNGCGGLRRQETPDLKCSGYWVYFGTYFKTTYSQGSKNIGEGGFILDATLQNARDVLASHNFFALNPPDITATDIVESILTVRRCNVITRILMYPILQLGGDPEVAALFADFDQIVARSKKQKISAHYLTFDLNVFDPDIFVPAPCVGPAAGVAGCVWSPGKTHY